MAVLPYHMTPKHIDGVFDVPKHSIDAFLRLSDEVLLGKQLFAWTHHVASVVSVFFMENGEDVFPEHQEASLHNYTEGAEAIMLRSALLKELAEQGFTLQVFPAEQLEVSFVDGKYILNEYSIGLGAGWCWIDQNREASFEVGEEKELIAEIIGRFRDSGYKFEI